MPPTPQQIKEIVEGESYGHEMRVRRILKAYRFQSRLEHGGGYCDPQSGKVREFDFRWIYPHDETVLSLAIECKSVSIETPVVMCGSKREPQEARHALIESRKGGLFTTMSGYIDVAAAGVIRNVPTDASIYASRNFVGRQIVQIKPAPKQGYVAARDSEIYDKWFQAVGSASDLVNDAMRYAERFKLLHVFTLVLPVVVLPDDTLWGAEYSEAGELSGDPVPTEECEMYVGRSTMPEQEIGDIAAPYTFSHLHFFTIKGFTSFLLKATGAEDVDAWRDAAFQPDVIATSKAERRS